MQKCHIELKKQIWGDKYIEICLVICTSDIKYFLTQWTIFKNKVPQELV